MRITAFALAVASACTACTSMEGPSGRSSATCRVGEPMVETQLFFGMNKPKGGVVGAAQWDAFVKREVVPRFPEGFSVLGGAGFWLDGQTKRTISEKSKVIVRMHADGADADQAISAIIEDYKTRFDQEAVLRVDRPVCAQF